MIIPFSFRADADVNAKAGGSIIAVMLRIDSMTFI